MALHEHPRSHSHSFGSVRGIGCRLVTTDAMAGGLQRRRGIPALTIQRPKLSHRKVIEDGLCPLKCTRDNVGEPGGMTVGHRGSISRHGEGRHVTTPASPWDKTVRRMNVNDLARLLRVNYPAPLHDSGRTGAHDLTGGFGRIINISSVVRA